MWVTAILAAGGRGTRLGAAVPKQMLMLGGRSILQRSFETLDAVQSLSEIIVALPPELASEPPSFLKSSKNRVRIVEGGATRHESVANAFALVKDNPQDRVMIHDAARPLATVGLFERMVQASRDANAAIAAVRAIDTVKRGQSAPGAGSFFPLITETLPRDTIYLAQTPQIFSYHALADGIELGRRSPGATDEAALVEQAGHPVSLVDGEAGNIKITTEEDLRVAEAMLSHGDPVSAALMPRIGVGYDLHRLEPGRKLILGGVVIPHETGLIGHSDADVLCHALTDAILGAAAQGDIGRHFPDTDIRWKDADSIHLLSAATAIVRQAGFGVVNLDAVVIAELPKLAPHIDNIRLSIARAVGVDVSVVSVKGKTNEKVGALGRNEAIAVHAVALLVPLSPEP
jgi:2-C-methyl-D-erythritol 4-phosphate cytidylyltransferase/2-C-methyl-D-erythritol 2,4-cyclodiphosphate synthase